MIDPLKGIAAKVVANAAREPRKAIRKQEPKPQVPWYNRLAFWWDSLWS